MASLRIENISSRVKRLRPVVNQIRRVPAGDPVNKRLLTRLIVAWGNFGYTASPYYLHHADRLFRTSEASTLECGSGVTTLLLALLAEKEGRYVWTFEHHEDWARYVRGILKSFSLKHTKVCHTPLRDYGGYSWYKVPACTLPTNFDLVVCDGPPRGVRGGRYGLLPVMEEYFHPNCRILLDGTHRLKDRALIRQWSEEWNLVSNRLGAAGRCTEISLM